MDPTRPESFNHRSERLSTGRTYHFVDQIPTNYIPGSTPTLLCLHGFPDLWYGWRYQIGPWTRKGYRTVVPDMLGYGQTDMPFDATQYSTKMLCNDLVALLDLLGVSKAIVVGHDWGSYTAGRFALWHPDRLLALVMMSVPYTPPSLNYMPVEGVVSRYQDFGYQAYFATHSSTADIDPKVSYLLQILYRKSDGVMPWTKPGEMKNLLINEREVTDCLLNHKELEYYVSQFSRGVLGPLSYYRTAKVRYEEEKGDN
ncbi:hypothetical protein SERLADRAFT_435482 [Serpula lacrymans var. lacrymans S7.9]|uniref:AB hydrolase-1 domain-containing protein n=1 Tax=Serpula lacrymans var. lacrymans (strain S7.9) TaxID=578457 RepID=F8NPM8_SERL9|nr:uncharacterized protein SERLADRAFT_435482 [Serpula lacrymans var. lacrymans S7.9]EGO27719.1 hypothetical protein SERLADRAFT_435482 [Serpula lacrymans var. lacrymans S7.9]